MHAKLMWVSVCVCVIINFCTFTLTVASDVQFGVLNHLSKIPGGLQGGTPLVLFDKNTRDTIVISPSSNFMDTNQATWTTSKGERVIGFGPLGSIRKVCLNSNAINLPVSAIHTE